MRTNEIPQDITILLDDYHREIANFVNESE